MKKIALLFTEKQREVLKDDIGVVFDNTHDYTPDELSDVYEKITDNFPAEFDENGKPQGKTKIYENLIDVFIKNNLVELN